MNDGSTQLEVMSDPTWPIVKKGTIASRILKLDATGRQTFSVSGLSGLSVGGTREIETVFGPMKGVAVIGLADDEGVRLNSGRVGARNGPTAVRAQLARYGHDPSHDVNSQIPVVDLGDVAPGKQLSETHDRISMVVEHALSRGLLPVGIGGGHDLTFALVRGVHNALKRSLIGLYLDAHLDVREADGSGMPFRKLITTGCAGDLTIIGMDPLANSQEHIDWFAKNGGRICASREEECWSPAPHFVSVDLDCIDSSQAPGVSAPNPNGLPVSEVVAFAKAAGRLPSVVCFDVMELNPSHDTDQRTARVAANLLLQFLMALALREPSADQSGPSSTF